MNEQPTQESPFTARIVQAEFSGSYRLILSSGNYTDKRRVLVYDSEPFFQVLTSNDPFILKDFHQIGRNLYPVWRLNLERGRVVSWAMLDLTPDEEKKRHRRDIFDHIYEDTRNLFLPYGDVENTIREVQQTCTLDELHDRAVTALQDFKKREECRKAVNLVAFRRNENDCWWWLPEPPYPTAEFTAKLERDRAVLHAYPRKG